MFGTAGLVRRDLLESRRERRRNQGILIHSRFEWCARLAAILATVMVSTVVWPSQVEAFVPGGDTTLPSGTSYYTIDSSFTSAGFLATSLYAAEQAWKVQNLTSYGQFYNSNGAADRHVYQQDGKPYGTWADATIGCESSCHMRFDVNNANWNTTQEYRDENWLDFVSVATHEFGHWVGLDHACNPPTGYCVHDDVLSSDWSTPTMFAFIWEGITYPRDISQDDVNGSLFVRNAGNSYPPTIANWGLDYTSPFYGWYFTGGHTRYCNQYSPDSSPCYESLSGSSYLGQQVISRNAVGSLAFMPKIRAMPGAGWELGRVRVSFNPSGTGAIYDCWALRSGNAWTSCWMSASVPGSNYKIDYWVQNLSSSALDVDTVFAQKL